MYTYIVGNDDISLNNVDESRERTFYCSKKTTTAAKGLESGVLLETSLLIHLRSNAIAVFSVLF